MEHPGTPELDKLMKVTEFSQPLGEFMTWLRDQGVHLRRWMEDDEQVVMRYRSRQDDPGGQGFWADDPRSTEQLLADYFQIDLVKAEAERRALLEYMRALQEAKR